MPEAINCDNCGKAIDPGAAQCPHCGQARAEAAVQSVRTQHGGAAQGVAAFRPGDVLANRYTVLQLIGRGGMGAIYKVRDNVLKEEVALKTLLPQFLEDKLVVERFYNEARIARQLAHANIVRVHDIGMTNGVLYISMEFLKGESLRMIIDRPGWQAPLSIDQIIHIFDQIAAALEYAHNYTVHRDIKPENVMVASDGSVKLMDFGISKLVAHTRLTQASVVMGTPHYMSPEQYKNSSAVDSRADIFSLGVMLYEVLTGNLPSGVSRPPSHVRGDVPPRLDRVVTQCLEPDPKDRYQTAGELRRALAEALQPDFAPAVPEVKTKRETGPWLRRGVALLAMVLTLAAAYWGVVALERAREAPAATRGKDAAQTAGAQEFLAVVSGHADAVSRAAPLIDGLWSQAEEAAAGSAAKQAALERGRQAWEAYQAAPDDAASAVRAAQCLTAVLFWPEGEDMMFVPPGEVHLEDGAVYVDGFFIDRREVTRRAYRSFLADQGESAPPAPAPWRDAAMGELPASGVTFADACAFAAARGKLLPTEAQWARAAYPADGRPRPFPWGETWRKGAANLDLRRPAPAGDHEKDQTPFGCLDMAGNVSEWTRSPAGAPEASVADISGEPFGTLVILRGGNFGSGIGVSPAQMAPLTRRRVVPLGYARNQPGLERAGFRCVRPLSLQLNRAGRGGGK